MIADEIVVGKTYLLPVGRIFKVAAKSRFHDTVTLTADDGENYTLHLSTSVTEVVSLTESEARKIAAGFISPSHRDKNLTAFATGHPAWNRDDLLAEITREYTYGQYDTEAHTELRSLAEYVKSLTPVDPLESRIRRDRGDIDMNHRQWKDEDGDILHGEGPNPGEVLIHVESPTCPVVLGVRLTPDMWDEIKSYVDSLWERNKRTAAGNQTGTGFLDPLESLHKEVNEARQKLFHSFPMHYDTPEYYMRKGMLDAYESVEKMILARVRSETGE